MENKHYTVSEWLSLYEKGKWNELSFDNLVDSGWFDWFCSGKDCHKKLKTFHSLFKYISNGYILNDFTMSFKNVCPIEGNLYDWIFLTSDKATLTIEHRNRKWSIYEEYKDNPEYSSFNTPRSFNSKRDLIKFLQNFDYDLYIENFKKSMDERFKIVNRIQEAYRKKFQELFDSFKESSTFDSKKMDDLIAQEREEISRIPFI